MALSFPVAPMKATLGQLPPDREDDRWAYEIKWDGYRTLAFVSDGAVRLQSSGQRDVTDRYPELAGLADGVHAGAAILDAELVVLDDDGRPRFELVQRHAAQAVLYLFDVLQIDGRDTVGLPYLDRRSLLEQVIEPGDNHLVPRHRVGDGAALFSVTAEQGLEGVMAKRVDSTYQPGHRSPSWRKVKHRRRTDVIVGGYTSGSGNRSGTFGSLLVGLPADGVPGSGSSGLLFAGGVGTGFDQAMLEALSQQLGDLSIDECPFDPRPPATYLRDAHWVLPVLIATIEIAEFTNDGLVRHASFISLRDG